MPKPKYRYVELKPSRSGAPRWYFRPSKTVPRIRLPNSYGSAEFEAAWHACMAGQPLPAAQGLPRQGRACLGKLGWLIALHLQSPEFNSNRASTQRPRRTMLEKLGAEKGDIDIEKITRSVIQDSVNARRETPHMANAWLRTVSYMFAWATEERVDPETGYRFRLEENPCEFVKRVKEPEKPKAKQGEEDDPDADDGHPTMTDEHMAIFEDAYKHGTYERLIYEGLLCTGFRVGDAAKFGRQHVKDDVIRLKTEKTRTLVTLRMLPRFKHAIALGPKGREGELAFLTSKRGKAWDKNYLGRFFGRACRKIGLDHTAHSMRKTAARRYIEAGARPEQLKAIFGWETSAMVDKYTKKFNRAKVSLGAMDDFVLDAQDWEEIENRNPPSPVLGGGKPVKRREKSNG